MRSIFSGVRGPLQLRLVAGAVFGAALGLAIGIISGKPFEDFVPIDEPARDVRRPLRLPPRDRVRAIGYRGGRAGSRSGYGGRTARRATARAGAVAYVVHRARVAVVARRPCPRVDRLPPPRVDRAEPVRLTSARRYRWFRTAHRGGERVQSSEQSDDHDAHRGGGIGPRVTGQCSFFFCCPVRVCGTTRTVTPSGREGLRTNRFCRLGRSISSRRKRLS